MTESGPSATPRRRRQRSTRASVRWMDFVARNVIRIGGIGTIAAISTVFVFLLWVVWPLLRSESLSAAAAVPASGIDGVVALGADESFTTLWTLSASGRLRSLAASDGSLLSDVELPGGAPTAWSFPLRSPQGLLGFADGSVRFVHLESRSEYRDADAIPPAFRDRKPGQPFLLDGKVAERVSADQFALRSLEFRFDDPLAVADGKAIVALDLSITSNGPAFASIDSAGMLRISRLSTRQNFMTGLEETEAESGSLALAAVATRGLPSRVLLRGLGDNALAVWNDGHAVRVDVRSLDQPRVAEELDLLPDASATITAVSFANGKNTVLVGDDLGRLAGWFRIPAPQMGTGDGAHFVAAHELDRGPAAVTAIAASPRTRLVAAGYADGSIHVFHVTTDRVVATSRMTSPAPVTALAFASDDGQLLAWNGSLQRFTLEAPHPEVSLHALTAPIFYEGYPAPAQVWQSSSGSDDFEPKFGLWPLVFGTMKATFWSMLFGVPIALLAAIYTSEFLRPEVKSVVKPAIEMMASLPSVVLGFLAALVLAPMFEDAIPELLCGIFLVPFALVLGAKLWQFVPGGRRAVLEGRRLLLAAAAIFAGLAAAWLLGPLLEKLLFAGDFRHWLDDPGAPAAGGLLLVTLPLSALVVTVTAVRFEAQPPRSLADPARRSLATFLAGTLLTLVLASAVAWSLAAAGVDLRGHVIGTYVQRNALVVGFVMAFAIIPIIYTIAEDALSSIPENLRSGSLALGATPWQTALRIVVPTAMSGLFSAIMVGLGRAVGETMIVLMAAGNTPVLEWNVFNGFRTLSANIAVELPEAVRNGTHYRTLFLAAFTLFVMTFVLNTAAELVRLRFRQRARQL